MDSSSPSRLSSSAAGNRPRRWYRPGELIVSADSAPAVVRRLDGDGIRPVVRSEPIAGLNLRKLTLGGREDRIPMPALVRLLRTQDPRVSVAPNRLVAPASHIIIRPVDAPRPPKSADLDLPQWDGIAPRPRVGVVDTGYWDHPSFRGRVRGARGSADLEIDAQGEPKDVVIDGRERVLAFGAGHGTFVAGCILQVAPQAEVVVRRVVADAPQGHGEAAHQHIGTPAGEPAIDDVELARGIVELDDVDILNLSLSTRLGSEHDLDDVTELMATANAIIEVRQRRPNLVIVAPAGNDGKDEGPVWPAAFDTVIAVGARTKSGKPAEFTNQGNWVSASDLGVDITSTYLRWDGEIELEDPFLVNRSTAVSRAHGGVSAPIATRAWRTFEEWAAWSGTSFAAARASGKIAAAMVDNAGNLPVRPGQPRLLAARDAAATVLNAPGVVRSQTLGVTL